MITSGLEDKTALKLFNAAADPTFVPVCTALAGFFNTFVANFLPALEQFFYAFEKTTQTFCLFCIATKKID